MAGLIAMTSVLIVVAIEQFFATRGASHTHESEYGALGPHDDSPHNGGASRPGHKRTESMRPFRQLKIGDDEDQNPISLRTRNPSAENLVSSAAIFRADPLSPYVDSPDPQRTSIDQENDSDSDLDEMDPTALAAGSEPLHSNGQTPFADQRRISKPYVDTPRRLIQNDPSLANEMEPSSAATLQEQKKLLLQCLLLEAGILFHSVFIGMALSVATGTSFVVLLVAISFHRTPSHPGICFQLSPSSYTFVADNAPDFQKRSKASPSDHASLPFHPYHPAPPNLGSWPWLMGSPPRSARPSACWSITSTIPTVRRAS